MINEAQVTIRNAGLLLAQRSFAVVGGFLFAVLVPRLDGSAHKVDRESAQMVGGGRIGFNRSTFCETIGIVELTLSRQ